MIGLINHLSMCGLRFLHVSLGLCKFLGHTLGADLRAPPIKAQNANDKAIIFAKRTHGVAEVFFP